MTHETINRRNEPFIISYDNIQDLVICKMGGLGPSGRSALRWYGVRPHVRIIRAVASPLRNTRREPPEKANKLPFIADGELRETAGFSCVHVSITAQCFGGVATPQPPPPPLNRLTHCLSVLMHTSHSRYTQES